MEKRPNLSGPLYFAAHFLIEVTSFYILSSYMGIPAAAMIALVYDYLAFVPQGLYGYVSDRIPGLNFGIAGTVLAALALVCFRQGWNPFLTVVLLAVGNGMIHIQGAEVTLHSSGGKMTGPALFVAGGSFGLITGKLMSGNAPLWLVMVMTLLILVPVLAAEKYRGQGRVTGFGYASKGLSTGTVIGLATLVVAVRAYMGYGIPTTWNKTVLQNVALYAFMGTGKALGGILIDRIGIRKTAAVSTLGALPFLLFGDNVMAVSLLGVMLFSMTMAVTLALIVSRIPDRCGLAFGFTTLGLFLGTLPIFFYRIRSLLLNCVIVAGLSLVSFAILHKICIPKSEEEVK